MSIHISIKVTNLLRARALPP